MVLRFQNLQCGDSVERKIIIVGTVPETVEKDLWVLKYDYSKTRYCI